MRVYSELPTVRLMACVKQLSQLADEIQSIVVADSKRHMMDQDLLPGTEECCDDVLAAIRQFINAIEEIDGYDPTPNHLWDGSGGEPVISAAERLAADWQQHLALHS